MKSFFTLICLLITFQLLAQIDEEFTMKGEIEGEKRGTIELIYNDTVVKSKVKSGKFIFNGKLSHGYNAQLRYKRKLSVPIYIENSKISLDLVKAKYYDNYPKYSVIWDIENKKGAFTDSLSIDYNIFNGKNREKPNYKYLLYNYLSKRIELYPRNYLYVDIINLLCSRDLVLDYEQIILLTNKMNLDYLSDNEEQELFKYIRKHSNR